MAKGSGGGGRSGRGGSVAGVGVVPASELRNSTERGLRAYMDRLSNLIDQRGVDYRGNSPLARAWRAASNETTRRSTIITY